jgi:Trk K+ transport system NAD-binding subunit
MKRNKFIIIGLGNTGLELLKKLSKEFDITCIDLNKDTEEEAKKIRSDCQVIVGDATSRLILEESGAGHHHYDKNRKSEYRDSTYIERTF